MEYTDDKRLATHAVVPGLVLEGRWRLVKHIGKGAMGVVFRGVDLHQKRGIAIKFLAARHCDKPNVLARFEREARLMTTLRHPNIIRLYDVGRHGVQPYIVMPFLRGLTLAQVLEFRQGRLSCQEALAVVGQMAAGLSFIHHHGLVHRDIKPQNVFVSTKGRVIILDLGVARDKSDPGLTKPGTLVGTPYYMAPEQISGQTEVDKRTDVYALAAMTFELLVGRPPFIGTNPFDILQAHKSEPPPDASRLSRQITPAVAHEISCGLAKNKNARPQSASEFYANLKVLIDFHEEVDLAQAFPFLNAAPPSRAALADAPPADAALETLARTPAAQAALDTLARTPQAALETLARTPGLQPKYVPSQAALQTLVQTPLSPPKQPCVPPLGMGAAETWVPIPRAPADKADFSFEDEKTRAPAMAFDETTPLPTPLLPQGMGEVNVVSTYRGSTTPAQLWVDAQLQGEAPTSLRLPEGDYVLQLKRPGGEAVEQRVRVLEGQSLLCRVELP